MSCPVHKAKSKIVNMFKAYYCCMNSECWGRYCAKRLFFFYNWISIVALTINQRHWRHWLITIVCIFFGLSPFQMTNCRLSNHESRVAWFLYGVLLKFINHWKVNQNTNHINLNAACLFQEPNNQHMAMSGDKLSGLTNVMNVLFARDNYLRFIGTIDTSIWFSLIVILLYRLTLIWY